MAYIHNGILLSKKKEGAIRNTMIQSQKHIDKIIQTQKGPGCRIAFMPMFRTGKN